MDNLQELKKSILEIKYFGETDETEHDRYDNFNEEPIMKKSNEEIMKIIKSPVRRSKLTHWSDPVTCNMCGVTVLRNNFWKHKQSKVHRAYEGMNIRVMNLLLDRKC